MVKLVHQYATPLRTASGETYLVRAYTDQQPGGRRPVPDRVSGSRP